MGSPHSARIISICQQRFRSSIRLIGTRAPTTVMLGNSVIRQQIGDVLEVNYEGSWTYLIVLSKIVLFGGSITYVFHGNGVRRKSFAPSSELEGFNIVTDLLMPKKFGVVNRLTRVANWRSYIKTDLIKACHPCSYGEKPSKWFISSIDDMAGPSVSVDRLSDEQKSAMDAGMYSFDTVSDKAIARYRPQDNELI